MRIGVDIRSLLSVTGRGVSHYTTSVLEELVKQNPDDRFTLLQTGRRPYALPTSLDKPNVTLATYRWPNKALNALQTMLREPKLDQWTDLPDVFFAPNLGFVNLSKATPLVLTIHDLAFVRHAEWFSARERLWLKAVRPTQLAQRADRIIAISEQTKQEIVGTYGVAPDKVTVVHSGIDERYREPVTAEVKRRVKQAYQLPEHYILYVGAVEPRKNLATLIAAWRLARKSGLKSDLIVAGAVHQAIKPEPGLRLLGYVEEADKPALYAAAVALVLLSLHEGFGFTPLEALAVGTPSLVSKLQVFSETLGDACVMVSATDAAAAAEKLVHLEQDATMRNQIITAGNGPLARLRWSASAAATRAVLAEAVEARHG